MSDWDGVLIWLVVAGVLVAFSVLQTVGIFNLLTR